MAGTTLGEAEGREVGHGAPPLFTPSLPPSFPDLGSLSTHYVLFLGAVTP